MTVHHSLPSQEIIDIIPPGRLSELGIISAVPIIKVDWFDERQTCTVVHDFLDDKIEGSLGDFSACLSYAAGICRDTGGAAMPCMFHESSNSLIWQRAREWERVVLMDGTTALQRRK